MVERSSEARGREANDSTSGFPPPTCLGWQARSTWQVHADYVVWDGAVVAAGEFRGAYRPLEAPQLVAELSRLATAEARCVLAFSRRWGLLGYAATNGEPDERGDPLWWIAAHARGVEAGLAAVAGLQSRDWSALARLLGQPDPLACAPTGRPAWPLAFGLGDTTTERDLSCAASWDELARAVLTEVVNPNLQGLTPALDLAGDRPDRIGLGLTTRFTRLLDVAYWQLAQLASGAARVGACVECRGFFVRVDDRERFCPTVDVVLDDPLHSERRRESRCARRSRKRRLTRRRKEGETAGGEELGSQKSSA